MGNSSVTPWTTAITKACRYDIGVVSSRRSVSGPAVADGTLIRARGCPS